MTPPNQSLMRFVAFSYPVTLNQGGLLLLPLVPSRVSHHGRRWGQPLGLKPVGQGNLDSSRVGRGSVSGRDDCQQHQAVGG